MSTPHQKIEPTDMYTTPSYVHGMRAGNTLYVAGQIAKDETGTLVAPGDAEAQAQVVFENLGKVLAAAGARPEYVVKVTTYLTDPADGAVVSKARFDFFGDHRPPHTGLIVGLSEGVKLEVEVVAVFP
jgi:enamine deaminase RidA (YjgF/YER057c/UK114 family)